MHPKDAQEVQEAPYGDLEFVDPWSDVIRSSEGGFMILPSLPSLPVTPRPAACQNTRKTRVSHKNMCFCQTGEVFSRPRLWLSWALLGSHRLSCACLGSPGLSRALLGYVATQLRSYVAA